ncbi:class I SAM-dependent methyltransferase [Thermoanaerobacterium thermosaccharolyticum]|uniref:class I SAM-dependent methyltransferase n=1 Tax=Thermoanaerobacterium thermosaccharolyticum TaxID=1517 RepID=UPI002150F217|nr:class I SAM-dependent methyltransferase [Thermoanaerobacterium thermosaccharolyticum]
MANNIEDDLKLAIDKLRKGDELVLDVGTGRARMAYALAKYGYCVVSIEYDINILKKARESTNLVNGDGKIVFIQGDAHHLPFLDESFGVVASYNAMHHMKDYKKAIDEMVRVCKCDGKILITELNESGKERVAEMHSQRGSHHESNIDIYDVVSYLNTAYNIKGEVYNAEYIDIFYGKK